MDNSFNIDLSLQKKKKKDFLVFLQIYFPEELQIHFAKAKTNVSGLNWNHIDLRR